MSDLIQRLRHAETPYAKPWDLDKLTNEAADALEAANARISGLESARIAYASEFAPDVEGLPDVGSIHANIRALKVSIAELESQLTAKTELVTLLRASLRKVEDEVEGLRRDAMSVFRVIAEQDPVELALDPQWAQRIARGAISAMQKGEPK